jgi:hypothetical protein
MSSISQGSLYNSIILAKLKAGSPACTGEEVSLFEALEQSRLLAWKFLTLTI